MSIYKKLLEIQKELKAIKKEKDNPFFKSKYADINDVLSEIKPQLNSRNVLLLQPLVGNGIETTLVDVEDNEVMKFLADTTNAGDAQKQGSAITYFRRYALVSLFAMEAEDDDGNVASGGTTDTTRFPKYVKKVKLEDMTKLGQIHTHLLNNPEAKAMKAKNAAVSLGKVIKEVTGLEMAEENYDAILAKLS